MRRRRPQVASLTRAEHVHFVGLGGIGVSALARILMQRGHRVSGSDLKDSPLLDRLRHEGAEVFIGHDAVQVGDAGLVVTTAAAASDNPELVEARRRRLPVMKRAEFLGLLMEEASGIAVAGSHGKTTTSAAIGYVLYRAGLDPTILVGGEMVDFDDVNARLGQGRHLVAEADEYDASFLQLRPRLALVTNVEPEHLDFYGSFEKELETFASFLGQVPSDGAVVLCFDDPALRELTKREPSPWSATTITYGFHPDAQWRASDWEQNKDGGYAFTVSHRGRPIDRFQFAIPGLHNVQNALGVVAAGSYLAIGLAHIRTALAGFRGVRRRFEVKGEADGIVVVDDYAHHPTEVRATLATARQRFQGKRLVCLFQPHTYSRTKLLLEEFSTCFEDADVVLIADIYPARERYEEWPITARDLAAAVRHLHVRYVGSLEEALPAVEEVLRRGDVFLTMGAGEADQVGEAVLSSRRAARSEGRL